MGVHGMKPSAVQQQEEDNCQCFNGLMKMGALGMQIGKIVEGKQRVNRGIARLLYVGWMDIDVTKKVQICRKEIKIWFKKIKKKLLQKKKRKTILIQFLSVQKQKNKFPQYSKFLWVGKFPFPQTIQNFTVILFFFFSFFFLVFSFHSKINTYFFVFLFAFSFFFPLLQSHRSMFAFSKTIVIK